MRSARTSDVAITANLNFPLFANSGGAGGVLDLLRGSNLVDLGFDVQPGAYQVRGSGLLRFYIATPTFFALTPEGAARRRRCSPTARTGPRWPRPEPRT